MEFNKAFHPTNSFLCVWQYSCTSVLRKAVLWKKDFLKRVKLDLEGKMVPAGFWKMFFLMKRPGSFCTSWYFSNFSFPSTLLKSLHLEAQDVPLFTQIFLLPNQRYTLSLIAVLFAKQSLQNQTKQKINKQKIKPENQDQTTKQNFQICFASERKRLPSPQFLLYYSHEDYTLFCCKSFVCTH